MYAMANPKEESAESAKESMLTSVRSLIEKLDPVLVPDDMLCKIQRLFNDEQYEQLLWTISNRLDFCNSEREKVMVGKLLLQSWQHAISFQLVRLKEEGEDAIIRQERKHAVMSCKEGRRRVQRCLDETAALQRLRMYVDKLMRTLNESSFKRFHQVQGDIHDYFYCDALMALTRSSSVVKVEHRLLLLKQAWESLYEHEKYRMERIEEICREQYFGGKHNNNAHIILYEKQQSIKKCEKGVQRVNAKYNALMEAKALPWWQWPKTKQQEKPSDASIAKQE